MDNFLKILKFFIVRAKIIVKIIYIFAHKCSNYFLFGMIVYEFINISFDFYVYCTSFVLILRFIVQIIAISGDISPTFRSFCPLLGVAISRKRQIFIFSALFRLKIVRDFSSFLRKIFTFSRRSDYLVMI